MRNHSKRDLLGYAAALPFVAFFTTSPARSAETVVYLYDELGRITNARYPDGKEITYQYDATGNRTSSATALTTPFNQTIQLTDSATTVNLRSLANAAGFNGAQAANLTFEVASAITINGTGGNSGTPAGGIGIDTGTWPTDTYPISLTLQISGRVRGGGGKGGNGGTISGAGAAGAMGGDAIYLRVPIDIVVNAGGELKSGGGGGGGGGGKRTSPPPEPEWKGGGGGGGGQPNGMGGLGGGGTAGNGAMGASPGAGGATWTTGGTGGNFVNGGNGGSGGTGGGAGGPGGAAGWAIRKNGNAVNVSNNGTVVGTIG